MKICSLLFMIFLFPVLLFGQTAKVDSLKRVLENEKNSNSKRLQTLESLSELLNGQSDLNSSIKYYDEMLKLAIELDDVKLQNQALMYISEGYKRENDFTNAEKFSIKAIKLTKSKKNISQLIRACNNLGQVYIGFQKYGKAITAYTNGISISNEHKNYEFISTLYSNLGVVYGRLNNTEKEIECYLKAAKHADKSSKPYQKLFAYYQLGYLYMNLEQYEKAEEYFKIGLSYMTDKVHKDYKYSIHHARGINFSRNGNFNEALREDNIALKHWTKTGNHLYEFDALNNIAAVYYRMKNYEKSLEYGKKAYKIAENLNNKRVMMGAKLTLANSNLELSNLEETESIYFEILKDTTDITIVDKKIKSEIFYNLSRFYKNKNDYKNAYKFSHKYALLNDSILSDQRDSNIAELETRYQTEKKEKQIAEQELQLAHENRNKQILFGGVVGLLLILGIGGFFFRRNQKQKKQIENLQKELHHRVKNNLSIIDTFIEVIKNEIPEIQSQQKLTELQNRIISINEVHRQLYQNKNVTKLNLKNYISQLAENIRNSFQNPNIQVYTNVPENINLNAERSFPLGLIVNEFLTNSYKYAFDENQKGLIKVSIQELKKEFLIEVSDNGKGISSAIDFENSKSFGLRIIKLLTEQLNGKLDFNTNNGVQLKIQIPKN